MIRLVYADTAEPIDGIRSYAEHCVQAIEAHTDASATLEFWRRADPVPSVDDGDVIVVQYNPFSYGRRGVAPWLVRRLDSVRRNSLKPRIVIVVHEAYVPSRSLKWALMGHWQRWQLAALARRSDALIVSTEAWRKPVGELARRVPIHHVPVSSNLPDGRDRREEVRALHGWSTETLVVAALGADPSARLAGHVRAAINELAASGPEVVFADLGAVAFGDEGFGPQVRHHRPGYLEASALASELGAADMFLAPFEDGISARRTTLAAALQHGLAVVGTSGRNTDNYLASDARLALADVDDVAAFIRVVVDVGLESDRRDGLRRGARALFEEQFSWPSVARRLVNVAEQLT